MKVDPIMCMKTKSRGQNVTTKMCCIPVFAEIENRQAKIENPPSAPCPESRIPCPVSRPEFRRLQHGDDFEIDQVIPVRGPALQQFHARRFHDLETPATVRFHPAREVSRARRQHPPRGSKPLADQRKGARLEAFNDHEQHAPKSTANPRNCRLLVTNCV